VILDAELAGMTPVHMHHDDNDVSSDVPYKCIGKLPRNPSHRTSCALKYTCTHGISHEQPIGQKISLSKWREDNQQNLDNIRFAPLSMTAPNPKSESSHEDKRRRMGL
jgi:hypothetical protein